MACDVVQDRNDTRQLNAMLEQVEEGTGRTAERTVADTGYATGLEFADGKSTKTPGPAPR